jgi:hypothetical protein
LFFKVKFFKIFVLKKTEIQNFHFKKLGMAIKPIPAGIRPNHTRFDGENPS